MIGFAASVGDRTFPSIPTHAIAESTLKRMDSPCDRIFGSIPTHAR
jgi:hypothetical protein